MLVVVLSSPTQEGSTQQGSGAQREHQLLATYSSVELIMVHIGFNITVPDHVTESAKRMTIFCMMIILTILRRTRGRQKR